MAKVKEDDRETAKVSPVKVPVLEKWQANTAYEKALTTSSARFWQNAASGPFTMTDGSTVTIGATTGS